MDADDLPAYTPQAITDILPIYHPHTADDHVRIYKLCQASPTTQTLALQTAIAASPVSYVIRINKTGGFMNRKPHVIISASSTNRLIAEGRFDIHGTGTTLAHFEPLHTQRLELENPQVQLLRTSIRGSDHWWQPHLGNKDVLELSNSEGDIVARFMSVAPDSQRRGSRAERSGSLSSGQDVERDLGELQVVESPADGDAAREEILCSAVVVIERAKRRAMNISGAGPKGPAAWGISATPPGGFT